MLAFTHTHIRESEYLYQSKRMRNINALRAAIRACCDGVCAAHTLIDFFSPLVSLPLSLLARGCKKHLLFMMLLCFVGEGEVASVLFCVASFLFALSSSLEASSPLVYVRSFVVSFFTFVQ